MLYDLNKNIDVERFKRRSEQLLKEGVVVELKKKVKRSTSQNSYIHLLIGYFSLETGYDLIESKKIYKNCSPDVYEYEKKDRKFIRSSADLTTEEMAISIDRFRNYSSKEAGIYLPEAGEHLFLEEIEYAVSRNKYI